MLIRRSKKIRPRPRRTNEWRTRERERGKEAKVDEREKERDEGEIEPCESDAAKTEGRRNGVDRARSICGGGVRTSAFSELVTASPGRRDRLGKLPPSSPSTPVSPTAKRYFPSGKSGWALGILFKYRRARHRRILRFVLFFCFYSSFSLFLSLSLFLYCPSFFSLRSILRAFSIKQTTIVKSSTH